jgi:hypothetical protein
VTEAPDSRYSSPFTDADPAVGRPAWGQRDTARRERRWWGALAGIAAAVAVVAVIDAALPVSSAPAPTAPSDGVTVSPAGSYSSSAFCAGGTGAAAATTVYLTNTTPKPVTGQLTAVGTAGGGGAVPTARRAVSVPAYGRAALNPADGLPSGSNASTFTFAGGGVAASQVVSGPGGWSTAPCASQTSSEWVFAGGSTAGGNLLTLSLFNPSAAESVVNVSFLTDSGVIVPQAYQGLTVPPGQLVTENVGDYVQGANTIATLVTAQAGTLVSTEFQQWAPGGTGGLSLRLGSPAPATVWRFAQTTTIPGATVDFTLANPGSAAVSATIAFSLQAGSVVPQQVAVAARSVAVVTASAIPGLPHQVPYGVTVTAGQPIAVGRSVLAPSGSSPPVWGSSPGAVTATGRWVVPAPGLPGAPGTAGASVRSLAVANPGPAPVSVGITRLGEARPLARFTVLPGGLTVLGGNLVGGLATYLVSSSGPVVVEEDSAPAGSPGVVSGSGVPLPG